MPPHAPASTTSPTSSLHRSPSVPGTTPKRPSTGSPRTPAPSAQPAPQPWSAVSSARSTTKTWPRHQASSTQESNWPSSWTRWSHIPGTGTGVNVNLLSQLLIPLASAGIGAVLIAVIRSTGRLRRLLLGRPFRRGAKAITSPVEREAFVAASREIDAALGRPRGAADPIVSFATASPSNALEGIASLGQALHEAASPRSASLLSRLLYPDDAQATRRVVAEAASAVTRLELLGAGSDHSLLRVLRQQTLGSSDSGLTPLIRGRGDRATCSSGIAGGTGVVEMWPETVRGGAPRQPLSRRGTGRASW